jgi:hypothetical protein
LFLLQPEFLFKLGRNYLGEMVQNIYARERGHF